MKPARRYTLGERVGAPKALREDANPNRASRGVAYPSEIIPEWWAKSSRNAERHQIGMRAAARAARPPLRDRGFADSPLEGRGFELSVPLQKPTGVDHPGSAAAERREVQVGLIIR